MITRHIILFLLISIFFVASCAAGEVKITTTYPSPYGEYDTVKTHKDTYLATDAGAKVGIGTSTPQGKLDVSSTTGGLVVPRMTTAKINGLTGVANGTIVYNSETNKFNFFENGSWRTKANE